MVDARTNRFSRICAVALAHLEQPTLSALSPPPALLRKAKKLGVLLVLLVAAPVDGYTPPQRWTRPAGSSASRSSVRAQAQQTLPSTSGAQPSTSILVRPAMPNVPMPQRPNVPLAPSPADQRSPQGQPYWFDERIHSFGNIGLGGRFHAFCAPIATRVIDKLSYGGVNVRERVHASLPSDATILDLCCGVGCSTLPGATGVDTSPAMLDVARFWYPLANFETGNAESYGNAFSYDVVTVMFATHEMPREARQRVLANAMRIARRQVLVVDIDPQFKLALVNDASRRTQVAANVPAPVPLVCLLLLAQPTDPTCVLAGSRLPGGRAVRHGLPGLHGQRRPGLRALTRLEADGGGGAAGPRQGMATGAEHGLRRADEDALAEASAQSTPVQPGKPRPEPRLGHLRR